MNDEELEKVAREITWSLHYLRPTEKEEIEKRALGVIREVRERTARKCAEIADGNFGPTISALIEHEFHLDGK